ncbi:MAG: O-antigen ligase family protein [Candidatus Aminicenantes bacterium]|nr:O-antigen ligase family protein [Candidatus Aminicenantes bacterium]
MKKTSWFDWLQIVLLALASPFFLFPSLKFVWIVLLLPALALARKFLKNEFFRRTPADIPVLLLLVQTCLTFLAVDTPDQALPKAAGLFFAVAVFYAVIALLNTEKLLKTATSLFLGAGCGFAAISVLGMFRKNVKNLDALFNVSKFIPKIDYHLPGAEEGINPNPVGGILILFIPLFLTLLFPYLQKKNISDRLFRKSLFSYFLGAGFFLCLGVLLLTQSRASWIALVLGCGLLFFPGRKSKKYAVILVLIFVLFYVLLIGLDKIPLSTQIEKERLVNRMELWDFAYETISEHPLLGFGMNRIRQHPAVGYKLSHVHNHFLQTAAEMGIPGLIAFLSLMVITAFMAFKTWKESQGWVRQAVLGLACGQLAHLIFGLADSIPLGAKMGLFFWLSLALITALYLYTLRTEQIMTEKEKND